MRKSTSCSTICGAASWSSGTTGTGSTICSAVRCCTRSCGSTSSNGAGRPADWCLPIVLPGAPSQSAGHQPPGGEHLPERGRVVRLALPPCPGRPRSPWGAVVLVRGQDCSHRLLLVSPPRAQTALPFAATRLRDRHAATCRPLGF